MTSSPCCPMRSFDHGASGQLLPVVQTPGLATAAAPFASKTHRHYTGVSSQQSHPRNPGKGSESVCVSDCRVCVHDEVCLWVRGSEV